MNCFTNQQLGICNEFPLPGRLCVINHVYSSRPCSEEIIGNDDLFQLQLTELELSLDTGESVKCQYRRVGYDRRKHMRLCRR